MTRWLAVCGRSIVGSTTAEDVGEARTNLREVIAKHPGAFVQSAVSYACGYRQKVRNPCVGGCGGEGRGTRPCLPCTRKSAARARWAKGEGAERRFARRKYADGPGVRGKDKGPRKARDVGLQSGASRQSTAQAHIWRGIVARQAKRTQTEA